MSKFKKFLAVALSVGLILGLTGCMQIEILLEVNKDDSGKLVNYTAVATQEGSTTEETSDSNDDFTGIPGVEVGDTITGKTTIEGISYDTKSQTIKFDNYAKVLIDESSGISIMDIDPTKGTKRVMFSSGTVSESASSDIQMTPEQYKALGIIMEFKFKTDAKVLKHNANSVKDGVYTWDVLSLNDKSAFIEFTGKPTTLPAPGKRTYANVNKVLMGGELKKADNCGVMLNKLGILKGGDKGLDLQKALTRAEGAVLYARLGGYDADIADFAKTDPKYATGFTDVPKWAAPTVNYLHYKGLIQGVSPTKFGSDQAMTADQYSTLLLRLVGYESGKDFKWNEAFSKANSLKLFDSAKLPGKSELDSGEFNRGSVAYMSYMTLFYNNVKDNTVLIDKY